MKNPKDLSPEEMQKCLQAIQEAIWPNEDPEAEWSSDTIDQVAAVMHNAGLSPAQKDEDTDS